MANLRMFYLPAGCVRLSDFAAVMSREGTVLLLIRPAVAAQLNSSKNETSWPGRDRVVLWNWMLVRLGLFAVSTTETN